MLVLALGDMHVPERAIGLPKQFKKLLQPKGKIDKVISLGNNGSSELTRAYIKSLVPDDSTDMYAVRGETDVSGNEPQSLVLTVDGLRIGVVNGYQVVPKTDALSLLNHARMMDVDVLVSGSTHRAEAYTLDGRFFVNPGTATGAYTADVDVDTDGDVDGDSNPDASFCLLDIADNTCTVYLYTLPSATPTTPTSSGDDVRIDRLVYVKGDTSD